jgi:hypothetical protein
MSADQTSNVQDSTQKFVKENVVFDLRIFQSDEHEGGLSLQLKEVFESPHQVSEPQIHSTRSIISTPDWHQFHTH